MATPTQVFVAAGGVDTRPAPSFAKASGLKTLLPGKSESFKGYYLGAYRVQFTVTNLSSAGVLKLRFEGANGATVSAAIDDTHVTPWTMLLSSDVEVFNPSDTETVTFEVLELFPVKGASSLPAQAAAASAGSSGAGVASYGSGGGSGARPTSQR